MSEFLLILLYVLAGLFVAFVFFVLVYGSKKFYQKGKLKPVSPEILPPKDDEEETESIDDTDVVEEVTEPVEETVEEVVEEPEVVAYSKEVAVTEETEEIEETEDIEIGAIEDEKASPRVKLTFSQKIKALEDELDYFNQIYNKFISYRKINVRVSSRYVSVRNGKKLIAKITVIGKTLKLHLALDVLAFNKNVYFQKDLSALKSYEEVPFTVKVRSPRGLKNALTLIEALCEKEGVEKKVRFQKIDATEKLI